MILLAAFAFISGIVTVLSPCILPLLPIILSSSIGDRRIGVGRPIGIILGFIGSFTFFTLFLSTIVSVSNISPDLLRNLSIFVIGIFGLSFLIPQFQLFLESLFSKLSSHVPSSQKVGTGYLGGLLIGISLGVLWTPCVGPILASVISLAITGNVTLSSAIILFSYAIGTAIPMFAIMIGGQNLLRKVPWLVTNTKHIQKAFGVIMILTSLALFFNLDRNFQTYILNKFPKYGANLIKIEDNDIVKKNLDFLEGENIPAPEIISDGEWFNSEPLTLAELKGKVVIIDFWTYSCINCQRTLPYLKNWYEKYKDDGLVIVGVHSPEFEFEKNPKNVQKAINDFGIKYPVVQDNDFSTWRAYKNRYWPAKYFIDKDGNIRYTHFGEGGYDESERVIQDLLKEAGKDVTSEINNPDYQIFSNTPEIYLGYGRIDGFASNERIVKDKVAKYSAPEALRNNTFAYDGEWLIAEEYAAPQKGSNLFLNFESMEVFLVMRPINGSTRVKVYIDGKMQYFGKDNIDGIVTVDSDDLYKLIKLSKQGRHNLRLEFIDGNIQLFAFTFG